MDLEIFQFQDNKFIAADIEGAFAGEKPAMKSVAGEFADIEGQLSGALDQFVIVGQLGHVRIFDRRKLHEKLIDGIRVGVLAFLLPGPPHRIAHQVHFGVVHRRLVRVGIGHLSKDCRNALQFLLRFPDMGKRVETDCGFRLKIEISGTEHIGHLLVGAADIDDPYQRAAGVIIEGDEVDLEGFPRAR
ncbi:MAG: hypothetical protein ACD_75C00935G0001 [uncultured bacterium]|nr:MAG: hypothetical protein ACD_75C00935G0001 [uncultured bacterium]